MNRLLSISMISLLTCTTLYAEESYIEDGIEYIISDSVESSLPIAQTIPLGEEISDASSTPTVSDSLGEKISGVTTIKPVTSIMNEENISTTELEEKITYAQAFSQAKEEGKILVIFITATNCHYCKKMEEETLSKENVKEALAQNFVLFTINEDEEELPLGLQEGMTPNFVFVDNDENIMDMAPGVRSPSEFIDKLNVILAQSK
jgi:thioredoxin-related protein